MRCKRGWVFKARAIEKLTEQIAATGGNASRMRPDVLKNTVEEFNAACAAGEKGPFYAILLFAGGSNTKGGLTTDADRRVLDWNGRPIEGLYAAGEIACGLNRGGAMLTDALVLASFAAKR